MKSKGEVGSAAWTKLGHDFRALVELVDVCCPSQLRYDFNCCNQTFVGHLGPLFEKLLVLLAVILVNLRKLPSENVLLSLRLICPAVPFLGALMKDTNDLI